MAIVKPFASKLQGFIELSSQSTMVILIGFIVYVPFQGDSISERGLMNVGYGMIAVILLNMGTNLLTVLVTSIVSLVHFCRRKKKKSEVVPHAEFEASESVSDMNGKHKA